MADRLTVKLSGEDTGGALSLSEHTNPPGTGVPTHIHRREDETFYVVEGEVEIQVGGETFIAREGDTAFLPRDVPHSWHVVGGRAARMLVAAVPAGLDGFFVEMSQLPQDSPPDVSRVLDVAARYGIEIPSLSGDQ